MTRISGRDRRGLSTGSAWSCASSTGVIGSNNEYIYAQTGYANPDAVTQIANGVSTTTYSYDSNGNLTSAGTSTFSWDYNNRMTQAVTQNSNNDICL